MAETMSVTGNTTVKFDVNRDGNLDEIIFKDPQTARLFEDCFVKGSETTECSNWNYQQARDTNFYTSIEKYRIANSDTDCGEGDCTTEVSYLCWEFGNQVASAAIERLWDNTKELVKQDPGKFTTALLSYVSLRMDDAAQKGWFGKSLRRANEVTDKERLSDAQITFLTDLSWKYSNTLFSGIAKKVNPSKLNDKVQSVMQSIDSKYFDAAPAAGSSYTYNPPDILLNDDDLIRMHRLFGRFYLGTNAEIQPKTKPIIKTDFKNTW